MDFSDEQESGGWSLMIKAGLVKTSSSKEDITV